MEIIRQKLVTTNKYNNLVVKWPLQWTYIDDRLSTMYGVNRYTGKSNHKMYLNISYEI